MISMSLKPLEFVVSTSLYILFMPFIENFNPITSSSKISLNDVHDQFLEYSSGHEPSKCLLFLSYIRSLA